MLVYLNVAAVAWLVGVVVGYLLGRLDVLASGARNTSESAAPVTDFLRRPSSSPAAVARAAGISIDDKKFVAPISTAGMERNAKIELGKTTAIADDKIGRAHV